MPDLSGRRIVVPETRELDLFAGMIEAAGATTLRCPLVAIHDQPDAAPVEAWLDRLIAGRFSDLVLFTGEGVNRLLGFAERGGRRDGALAAFRGARKIVRGPKPTRALRAVGLEPEVMAEEPTSEGVIAAIRDVDFSGRAIGYQTYPKDPMDVAGAIERGGGAIDAVAPYIYASAEDGGRVAAVVRAIVAGEVDAVAFTSSPQVRRMAEVAKAEGLDAALTDAFAAKVALASIGPVTTKAAEDAGWRIAIEPKRSFRMKPFVAEMAAALAA